MTFILLIILALLISNPNIASVCVISTSKIWLHRLVPILYPNLIIIDLLSSNYYLELISNYMYRYLNKVINLNHPKSFLVLIISFITGAPASAKLINSLVEDDNINEKEADSLIYATSNLSLPYIIYILNLFNVNIFMYIFIQILYTIIVIKFTNKTIIIANPISKKRSLSYINILFKSINKNIDILLSILGVMIFFNIILSLINVNDYLYSYFEILNGHTILYTLIINKNLKDLILISSLSLLGISMHLQIFLVYPKLKYFKFIITRLFNCLMCMLVLFF